MNPLTQVKRTQKINAAEAALGISEEASWHAKYKASAYVFVGGIPFDLTEGDLLAVFAQYGEVVDVNLVRDKGTGKSKGFAFLAYEDQRSTILAVDNLNGAKVLGRIVRVDHVSNYKKKKEENEEEEKQRRESRGVCYAFQRGECNRGAGCKFSHDEQRNANTGWGSKDGDLRWDHDRHEDGPRRRKNFLQNAADGDLHHRAQEGISKSKSAEKHGCSSRSEYKEGSSSSQLKRRESYVEDEERRGNGKFSEISNETESEGRMRCKSELNQGGRNGRKEPGNEKRLRHGGDSSLRDHGKGGQEDRKRAHR